MIETREKTDAPVTLEELLAEGGIVGYRLFVVLVNRGVTDGEEKLAKVGNEFATYAGAMGECERFLPEDPSARVFEIVRYFHLDVPTQRAQFEAVFKTGDLERMRIQG